VALVIGIGLIAQACTLSRADRLYATLPPEIDGPDADARPDIARFAERLGRSTTFSPDLTGLAPMRPGSLDPFQGSCRWTPLRSRAVTADQLRAAIVDTWTNAAVTGRKAIALNGFDGARLTERDGSAAFVYGSRGSVYVVTLPSWRD